MTKGGGRNREGEKVMTRPSYCISKYSIIIDEKEKEVEL